MSISEKIEFVKEKETKNTVRYKEVQQEGKPSFIGTPPQKWFAGSAEKINVTIEKG